MDAREELERLERETDELAKHLAGHGLPTSCSMALLIKDRIAAIREGFGMAQWDDIREVLSPSELVIGDAYWLQSKTHNRKPTVSTLKEDMGIPYFEMKIWASDSNPQAFQRWRIFGPVPTIGAIVAPAADSTPPMEAIYRYQLRAAAKKWAERLAAHNQEPTE